MAQQGSDAYMKSIINNYNEVYETAIKDPRLGAPGHEAFTAQMKVSIFLNSQLTMDNERHHDKDTLYG